MAPEQENQEKISISQYHTLAKNSLWVMLSNLSLGFVLLMTVISSRVLGDVVFGQYTFLLAIATILVDLSVLGTTDYVSIIVAREPDRTGELVANSFGLRIIFGSVYLAVCMLVVWLSMPFALLAGFFIAIDWVVRTLTHMLRGVLRARNRYGWDTRAVSIERLAVLVCASIGLLLTQRLEYFALGFFIGRLVGFWACLHAYKRLGEQVWVEYKPETWKGIIRGGFPIGFRGMLKGISFRVDAFVLGLMRITAEVGWYGAAYKFLEAGFLFQDAVGGSFQPAISRAFGQKNPRLVADLYGRAYKLLLIVGGLTAAFLFVNAEPIVMVIFGIEYINAVNALRILIWAMPLVFGTLTSIVLLDSVGAQGRTVPFFIISTSMNLALNLALIPYIGYMGAALTTVVTESFLSAILIYTVFRSGYRFPLTWLLGPVCAAVVFTVIGLLLQPFNLLGATIGLTAYILTLVFMKVFDQVDLGYGRQLILRLARR
jgi:O-antigen/teichoic acid export membrane protein